MLSLYFIFKFLKDWFEEYGKHFFGEHDHKISRMVFYYQHILSLLIHTSKHLINYFWENLKLLMDLKDAYWLSHKRT